MPEHFSPEATAKRPKFSWFPFGGGPRLCLGFKFAEVEALIAMSMVYQKYDLKLIPGQQVKPRPMITLRPDRPILFRVTPRAAVDKNVNASPQSTEENNAAQCPIKRLAR
jgi:cytochrome P450